MTQLAILLIVAGGVSDYTIVIPDQPVESVTYAAQELQSYLQRITGAVLPIVAEGEAPDANRIFTGPCAAAARAGITTPKWERFVARVVDGDLFIVGGDSPGAALDRATRTGTLYGVYGILERFGGVRWLWPGELGEVVPRSPDFGVPAKLNLEDGPDFRIRNLWLTYHNPGWVRTEYMSWWRRTGQGQDISGNAGHAYSRLLGGKYFDEHPEYYALVNGERRPMVGTHGQICTSNPEVVEICAQAAAKDPRDIVPISPNDGSGFCECDRCRALDVPENTMMWGDREIVCLTDRIFTFANQVAERVAQLSPGKLCGHFCYTFFKKPPMRLEDLADNLVLFFAYGCHWYRDPATRELYHGYIDGWSRYGNPMVAREYYGLIYWHGLPNIHTRMIEEDIKYIRDRGFIGLQSEMCRDFATHGPNYYLAAKLLWDTDRTREEILDDYYRAGFGPAADDVAEYFDIFERRLASLGADARGAGSSNVNNLPMQFDPDTVAAARAALERAYTRTDDPTITARLDFIRIGLEYTDTTARLIELLRKLNGAGMSFSRLEPEITTPPPDRRQVVDWVLQAKALNDRRWEIIESQGKLPALHRPALDYFEERTHWGANLQARYEILADEAGRFQELPLAWRFAIEGEGDGEAAGWHLPDFDDSGWGTINTNQPWEKQGHEGFNGVGWYRTSFEVTDRQAASERVILRLGAVDEDGWVWLNGENVGGIIFDAAVDPSSWTNPLDIDITGRLRPGRNVLAVRVRDRVGQGGLWKRSYLIYGEDAPNLLQNGSFENGAEGWSFGGKGDVSHEIITGTGYQSQHCVEVHIPDDPDAHWSMSTLIEATPGERYAFSFRYRTRGVGENPKVKNSPAIRFIMRDAQGKPVTPPRGPGYVWSSVKPPSDSDEWLEATFYVKAIEGAAGIYVTTFLHRPGTWWLDDVRMWKIGAGGDE
ncbi:MAG: DUF4838 domain-containing protein [Armatimonadetes bacterium]|nr:DUF4838 domain-containing protein [Armatimonadota bacterium]